MGSVSVQYVCEVLSQSVDKTANNVCQAGGCWEGEKKFPYLMHDTHYMPI